MATSSKLDNHYALLGLSEDFAVDPHALAGRFKQMQRQWHPDKYATGTPADRETAADMSARLNVAYDVLRVPHRRAQHLLHLRAAEASAAASSAACSTSCATLAQPSHEFLAWVMQFREELADATEDVRKLRELRERLAPDVETCVQNVGEAFAESRLEDAARETAKLQYFASIQKVFDNNIPPS